MKRILIFAFSGIILTACGDGKMGEKAGEGSTGESKSAIPDTGKVLPKNDSIATGEKSNY